MKLNQFIFTKKLFNDRSPNNRMTPNTSLQACLLKLELPLNLFICLEVLGNFCHFEVLSGFFVLSKLLGNP